jgi:hypothetical protein
MIKQYISKYIFPIFLLLFSVGCWVDEDKDVVEGYRPVYGTQDADEIKLIAPQSIRNPGKIYVYGNYLLVNETAKGIHVFDNQNPKAPEAVGFIQMLGNTDMAIRNDVLYADHMGDLVALEIDDFERLTEQGTLPLQNWNLGLPPPPGAYFQCVDASKGLVIGWEKMITPKTDCYAIY